MCEIAKTDSFTIKQSSNLDGPDGDDIARLLDSVPVLDSVFYITQKIGHGTFSSVYLGHTKKKSSTEKTKYAIKHIIPTSHPSRVYMELKCLKLMGGNDNIIEASFCFRNLNHIVLIMPYFQYDSFSNLLDNVTPEEVSRYIMNLCIALSRVHSFHTIHRDIKPSNFLYSRKLKRYALIDFGLAQELCPSNESVSRTAKRLQPDSPLVNEIAKKARLELPFADFSNQTEGQTAECVRRSPRKVPSLNLQNLSKENLPSKSLVNEEVSPGASWNTMQRPSIEDSPSKNTRLAEVIRHEHSGYSSPQSIGLNLSKSSIFTPSILRRSPRKPVRKGFEMSFDKIASINNSFCESSMKSGFGSSNLGASLTGHSFSGTPRSLYSSRIQSRSTEKRTRSGGTSAGVASCGCYGHAKVCQSCLGRRGEHAPRAGTPGFRAPEVLLRHPNQTTAIDMWSVGVILLCLMSGRYPFFRAVDDLSSLMEIITIFGTKTMKKVASHLGKLLSVSEDLPALDLRKICEKFRKVDSLPDEDKNLNPNLKETITTCKGCKQITSDCVCQRQSKDQLIFVPRLNGPYTSVPEDVKDDISNYDSESKYSSQFPASAYDLLYKLLEPNPDKRISADEAVKHEFLNMYSKK